MVKMPPPCTSRAREFDGSIMRCRLARGHEGEHTDGCVAWTARTEIGSPQVDAHREVEPSPAERETAVRYLYPNERDWTDYDRLYIEKGGRNFATPDAVPLAKSYARFRIAREEARAQAMEDVFEAIQKIDAHLAASIEGNDDEYHRDARFGAALCLRAVDRLKEGA